VKSRIIPYVIMTLLLAAHFSRAGNSILMVISLLLPFLFFVKQKWVLPTLEIAAYLAAAAWLWSAYQYIQVRIATGDDWMRLLIIMGSVALFTAWTGFFLRSEKMKAAYGESG